MIRRHVVTARYEAPHMLRFGGCGLSTNFDADADEDDPGIVDLNPILEGRSEVHTTMLIRRGTPVE